MCTQFKKDGIVGIDCAGDELQWESHGFNVDIVNVFKEAKKIGIRRTCHAGEVGPASNVKMAIEEMQVERIGHGYHIVDDIDFYPECLLKQVHFECCPSSSYFTGERIKMNCIA